MINRIAAQHIEQAREKSYMYLYDQGSVPMDGINTILTLLSEHTWIYDVIETMVIFDYGLKYFEWPVSQQI